MAKLTSQARDRLPQRDFALPGRRYPDENPSHARNALARVSQHGSPQEKTEVRTAVHDKYPSIGQHSDPRHHSLSMASATHLANMGHISADHRDRIHAHAQGALAQHKRRVFGSMAPAGHRDVVAPMPPMGGPMGPGGMR